MKNISSHCNTYVHQTRHGSDFWSGVYPQSHITLWPREITWKMKKQYISTWTKFMASKLDEVAGYGLPSKKSY